MTNLVDLAARLQSWRRGAWLVELLVCLAIIATMITLLFPAIQSVRAGMKRAECGDHKRQLSLAIGMYMEAARALPPAPTPTFPGGWAREILPFMEEKPLFEALDLRQLMTAAGNATAARSRPPDAMLLRAVAGERRDRRRAKRLSARGLGLQARQSRGPPAGAAADEGLRLLLLSRRTGHHRRVAGLGRGGPQCARGA